MPVGRPAHTIRPIALRIHVPEDVATRVELELFSELEGKVPHGARSRLITELLRDWLHERQAGGEAPPLASAALLEELHNG